MNVAYAIGRRSQTTPTGERLQSLVPSVELQVFPKNWALICEKLGSEQKMELAMRIGLVGFLCLPRFMQHDEVRLSVEAQAAPVYYDKRASLDGSLMLSRLISGNRNRRSGAAAKYSAGPASLCLTSNSADHDIGVQASARAVRYIVLYSFFSHVPIQINARRTAGGAGG
jgi:hypothetical protein